MNTDKWTVSKAQTVFAKLTKVANDLVDAAAAAPAPEDGAGSAGPQEVVDALDVIVDQLEEVQEAIPAEPTNEEPEEAPAEEAPVEDAPVEEPEEEEKLAKIKTLEAQLDKIQLEKVAQDYAELFDEPKVQQAKYDEVLNSGKKSSYWTAQIETIEQYKQHEGASSNYKPAQTKSSWITPRSKMAKQADSGMMSL